ncbi:MAG: hypothetical protein ACOCXH_09355 [Cyclobacteriaceae bacterium]
MKLTRFSSSRTGLFKIALLGISIYLIIWTIVRVIHDELDLTKIGIICLSIIIAVFFLYVNYYVFDLKAFKSDIEISSVFGKRYKLNIGNIKPYGMTSFSLTLIDPMSFTKLTKIKFKSNGKDNWVFILNPTIFSSNNDIEKVIMDIRKKHYVNDVINTTD